MNMISFTCDYLQGGHPAVLQLLLDTNEELTPGYGEDVYCERAARLVRQVCDAPQADVHFLVGGTQANATVIDAALRPHQGVLAAASGHINVHESGAVEAAGHKVLALPSRDGKITAAQVRDYCRQHWADEAHEHMVQPALVYISHPTELGSIYSKAELSDIHAACRELGLRLFIDGARLAYALAAPDNDLSLADLARLCDAFYIGGTKCGALLGEAVVLLDQDLKKDFRYIQKQHAAMLAKGRLLGLQFLALLQDGLYERLGRQGDEPAGLIASACAAHGIPLLVPAQTNQLFPIFSRRQLQELARDFQFNLGEPVDPEHQAVRIVTSWSTSPAQVQSLIEAIGKLS